MSLHTKRESDPIPITTKKPNNIFWQSSQVKNLYLQQTINIL
jgi:hypothetical protein